jgi:type VI secretion system secreted protein VgrG
MSNFLLKIAPLMLGAILPSVLAAGPAAVDLGSVANFAMVGGTSVTNNGLSDVYGDVGSATLVVITGFEVAEVFVGTKRVAEAVNIADMVAAHLDATGRTDPTAVLPLVPALAPATPADRFELGPGVYSWPTMALTSTTGDLFLNGTKDDTWIFQCTTIAAASGSKIVLVGGAVPQNVVFVAAGTVIASASSHLEGVFLAKGGISLADKASINGRMMSATTVTITNSTVDSRPVTDMPTPSPTALPTGTPTTSPPTSVSSTTSTTPTTKNGLIALALGFWFCMCQIYWLTSFCRSFVVFFRCLFGVVYYTMAQHYHHSLGMELFDHQPLLKATWL